MPKEEKPNDAGRNRDGEIVESERCCTHEELLTLLAREKCNNYRLFKQNRLMESKIAQLCAMLHARDN